MNYPKVGFIAMSKDIRSVNVVQQTKASIMMKRIHCTIWIVDPIPINPNYFSDNLRISAYQSGEIFGIFFKNSFVDMNGILLEDPRTVSWFDMLLSYFSEPEIILENQEAINELLNAAFAYHEMTRAHAETVIRWIL